MPHRKGVSGASPYPDKKESVVLIKAKALT
jgi:hypothetical protein